MISRTDITLQHALFLAKHLYGCDLDCVAIVVLLELGVPTKGMGFDYLKHSVVLLCENPSLAFSKGIYPVVGQLYSPWADGRAVEMMIRRTINAAWRNRDENMWIRYFPVDDHGRLVKPTTTEFVSRIAIFLRLWQGCCKGVSHEKV